jgi:hypothetical protein
MIRGLDGRDTTGAWWYRDLVRPLYRLQPCAAWFADCMISCSPDDELRLPRKSVWISTGDSSACAGRFDGDFRQDWAPAS